MEEAKRIAKGFKEALNWDHAEMFVCNCGERWLCGMNSPDLPGIRSVNSEFKEARKYYVEKDDIMVGIIHLCTKCGKPITMSYIDDHEDMELYDTYELQPYSRWEKKQAQLMEKHNNS